MRSIAGLLAVPPPDPSLRLETMQPVHQGTILLRLALVNLSLSYSLRRETTYSVPQAIVQLSRARTVCLDAGV